MPGVQTPLSWTLWARGVDESLRNAAFAVGALDRHERRVPESRHERYIRIFRGRVAVQVEFLTMLGDRMPGTTGQQAAADVLGEVPEEIAYLPTRRRYPFVFWRFPRTFLTAPGALRRHAAVTERWYPGAIQGIGDLDEAAARVQFAEARDRFVDAVILQTVGVFAVVQPMHQALEKLVERAGVGDVGILSGSGGAEMAIIADVWAAADGRLDLDEVIRRHGFHGPLEGELSSRVWREDPTPLEALLERYAGTENPAAGDRAAELGAARRELIAALPRRLRGPARLVLCMAPARIQSRGVIKRSFLQCFDVVRASARRLGDLLAADGVLEDPEDVFYLTVDEVQLPPADVREVVDARQRLREAHRAIELPTAWRGHPAPVNAGGPETESQGERITGVGVSAGVVEGIAHVVTDPSFADVAEGQVLVASTTDPSWSSIMFVSSALVVDIGGALSHAAVVARELGIPCVVSTRDGTQRIRTGDRVRVDGSAGTVEVLEPG